MNFSIGDTMGGYEIVGLLGSGGMGEVYRVRNVISDRVDAMKVLLANLQRDDDFATRFLREIKVQARLVHPNITQLYTAFEHDGNLMMIMELIDGLTLLEMLQRGRIPLPDAIDYTQQALTALSYAHGQGVIHRDIKPGNIMVTSSGAVKLMDFGIAKAATDRSLTITGNLIGSLYYMSPEQVKALSIDSRSDLYSVGVVLYQMATGKKPFDGDSEYRIMRAQVEEPPQPPKSIEPSVPDELSNVILRALAKNPADRFQTGEEFREALERVARLLQIGESGATRILGGDKAAPQHRARQVPTAPLRESRPVEPAPVQPESWPPASGAHAPPHEAPLSPPVDREPVRLPHLSTSGPQHDAKTAAGSAFADEEPPARSRTGLWIAAGIAAAVLTVAATQMFDWVASSPSDRPVAGDAGRVETPADPEPPAVAPADSESAAATTSAADPTTPPPQDNSAREAVSRQPQSPTPKVDPPPVRRQPPASASPVATPPERAAERTAPSVPERASATSSPATSPPGAGSESQPPLANSGSQTPPAQTTESSQAPAATSATSQQQASSAGGQPPVAAPVASNPAPADRVYLRNEVDALPEMLHRVQPRYSDAAARARAEGVVRLEAEIWPDGRAHNIKILQSAGHADLNRNAVEALQQWRFIPARKDGVPVKVRAPIDFPFSLQTTTQRPALSKEK